MKVVFLLLALVAVLCNADDRDVFNSFLAKYQKDYFVQGNRQEYNNRFAIFKSNLRFIEQHNALKRGFSVGLNEFSDMTHEEFRAAKKGAVMPISGITLPNKEISFDVNAIPTSFNWIDKGVVGPVQNEGECGSSLDFAVVESLSSIYTITSGSSTYIPLDVEEITTCSKSGCSGTTGNTGITYIEQHGLSFNFSNSCPKGKVEKGVCISGSSCSLSGNETALAVNLLAQGPLFVGIDGSDPSFELYTTGIYGPPTCSTTKLDTALLLVGYNEQAWICQNSWGESWGMKGLVWIARNHKNMCGIATSACYPTGVAKC